jgi:uncharacterized membrane protein YfcA
MVGEVLRIALAVIGVAFSIDLVRVAIRKKQLATSFEAVGLGAVTNFFDTLGIGSFATTTAWIKFRKLVPDSFIPATLNTGHALPTIVEALAFIGLVAIDPYLLGGCIGAAALGSLVGAPIVVRMPVRGVQAIVGVALVIAAGLYAMKNLNLMPGDGAALSLPATQFWIAVAAHFVMGALMAFGIGLYAPSLIVLSLLGLNPLGAFPIMMGACAFLMPVAGARFIRTERIDLKLVLGIALGGIPGVLIAVFVVKSLPLIWLRWGVVVVVLYAALLLLRSAFKPEETSDAEPAVSGAQS